MVNKDFEFILTLYVTSIRFINETFLSKYIDYKMTHIDLPF